jgi:hypothetical protein
MIPLQSVCTLMSKGGNAGDDAVCCCCWGDVGDDDTAAAACEPFGSCIPLLEYVCSPTTLHPNPNERSQNREQNQEHDTL